MPSFLLTSPQGQKFKINAPDGATQEQVLAYAQQQFAAPQQKVDQPENPSMSRTLLDQGVQGATFGFGDEISDFLGAFGSKVYSTAFDPELTAGKGVGDLYNEARGMSKQRLSAEFEQNPVTSIAANLAGGLLTGGAGLSTKTGTAVANSLRTGNTATRIGKGMLAGAASGGLYGAGSADDGNRVKGATTGAAIGGAIPLAIGAGGATLKAGAKALTPTIEEGMRPIINLAQKYKIPVALSQVGEGNAIKNFQKVSKELPFSGESAFREKQMKAFNHALIKTTGGNSNRFSPELMDNLFTKVGKEFDDFGKGKSFNLNEEFIAGTSKILDDAEIISKGGIEGLNKQIAKIYADASDGVIRGELLAKHRGEVNRLARKAGKTGNAEVQELLHDLENVIIDTIKSGDDAAGQAFAKTKQKYKNLLVIEPLAAKAKGGNVSPSQLHTRVSKIYGRQFTRGNAGEIGDLARIGNELLPELGGSDTVQKAIYGGGLGTLGVTALTNPVVAAAAATKAGMALGANRLVQSGFNRNQSVINAALKKSRLKSVPKNKPVPRIVMQP